MLWRVPLECYDKKFLKKTQYDGVTFLVNFGKQKKQQKNKQTKNYWNYTLPRVLAQKFS